MDRYDSHYLFYIIRCFHIVTCATFKVNLRTTLMLGSTDIPILLNSPPIALNCYECYKVCLTFEVCIRLEL